MKPTLNLFRSGDNVVYPSHGLGTVIETRSELICNKATKFLVVAFELGLTVLIPLGNIHKSGLRRVSSRAFMENALRALGEPPSRKRSMWRHRALEFAAKMKTAEPRAMAEIIRDLYRASGKFDGSYSEKAIYQRAWDQLIPEVAAVDGTDRESAAQKVTILLEAA